MPARRVPVLGIVGRLALLGYVAWEAVRQLRSDDFAFSLFGGVIFGVHELGHLVFAPFGELLGVAGGSIAQILLPIGAIALFAKQQHRYAVAVCGCWLAISLGQLGVYVADARAEQLELVSFSEDGAVHDWNYLLERFYLLRHDAVIARGAVHCLGRAGGKPAARRGRRLAPLAWNHSFGVRVGPRHQQARHQQGPTPWVTKRSSPS